MTKKEVYTILVLGMMLIALTVLTINQGGDISIPALPDSSSVQPGESLSCPINWDADGWFFTKEIRFWPEEAFRFDQVRWDNIGELH